MTTAPAARALVTPTPIHTVRSALRGSRGAAGGGGAAALDEAGALASGGAMGGGGEGADADGEAGGARWSATARVSPATTSISARAGA